MGPLSGKKIIELKGIGPGPYAGMLLADLGAEVIVVERSSKGNPSGLPTKTDVHSRGKKSVAIDLKTEAGVEVFLRLVESADAVFEGLRPGTVEKLGVGPSECQQRNKRLVYGRMTGWGQHGPLAHTAGHDLNYISLSGVAAAIGTADNPTPPLNLIGDFAAGSLFLVVGILAALIEAEQSGQGQVVDAAISDGSAHLMSMFYTLSKIGMWTPTRATNFLDGGAPYYSVYRTADNKHVSVAAIEPHFFAEFIDQAELPEKFKALQNDRAAWPEMRQAFELKMSEKSRDEWVTIFEGTDSCATGVLNYEEALDHPHNVARETYVDVEGEKQPAPAPRFSRSSCAVSHAGHQEGYDTVEVLTEHGFTADEIDKLKTAGALS